MYRLIAFALLLLPAFGLAQELPFEPKGSISGAVVHVADGDTITILTQDKTKVKVRLWGIDCPESKQAFGKKATTFAKTFLKAAVVTVAVQGHDRYGRTLGWVIRADGASLNEALLSAGFAWWYQHYAEKAEGLAALESEARRKRLGLWHDSDPMPPWDFRRYKKK